MSNRSDEGPPALRIKLSDSWREQLREMGVEGEVELTEEWEELLQDIADVAPELQKVRGLDGTDDRLGGQIRAVQLAQRLVQAALEGPPADELSATLGQVAGELRTELARRSGRATNRSLDAREEELRCVVLGCADYLRECAPGRDRKAGPRARRTIAKILRKLGDPRILGNRSHWPSCESVANAIRRWDQNWFQEAPESGLPARKDMRKAIREGAAEGLGDGITPEQRVEAILSNELASLGFLKPS